MYACMSSCMQNIVKHSFSNFSQMGSSSLIQALLHQILNKNIRLGHSNPKPNQKDITWASWTNSRPQYLTIPIELILIDHIPLRRTAMDSFCSVIIRSMSWTKRWSFSFSFWSSKAFFSSSVFSIVHPVFLPWTPPLMVANSSTSSVLALENFGSKLVDWFELLKFIFPTSISVCTYCLRERQSSVECPGSQHDSHNGH